MPGKCVAETVKQLDIVKQKAKRGYLELYSDDESSTTNSEIKTMLLSLTAKIDSMNDTMSGKHALLNNKIDNLECAMSTKIAEVKNEMENRMQSVVTDLDTRTIFRP